MTSATSPIIDGGDLRDILADAFTSFSPLGALVGANATRSLSNHISNKKQLVASALVPIGVLGSLSTICKGTNLNALKDLLGAGENDIMDAASDLGCGALYGIVPRFSKRGGLTCHEKTRNRGVAASAVLRGEWKLHPLSEATDGHALDIKELEDEFLAKIFMSTISGRLVWECKDDNSQKETVARVRSQLLQSWNADSAAWDMNMFSAFQNCEDPLIRNSSGMIELHWLTPAMPLEQNATIVFLFIAIFTIVPTTVIGVSASPQLQWQTPTSAALLLGGQLLLGIGKFLAQWVLHRQRHSVYIDVPRRFFSDSWMLVDNTWFTSMLARRRISHNPLSPNTVRIGQHVSMGDHIPAWQALGVLLTVILGFLALYIGARSSNLWVILFEIGWFFLGNLFKGAVLSIANEAYVTNLNNPGFANWVEGVVPKTSLWQKVVSALSHGRRLLRPRQNQPDNLELENVNVSATPVLDEKPPASEPMSFFTPSDLDAWMVPLPKSRRQSLWSGASLGSINEGTDVQPFASSSRNNTEDEQFSATGLALAPYSHYPPGYAPAEQEPHSEVKEFRVYAKFAVRRNDAIGLFYFSQPRAWGAAAHIIYETLYDRIQWTPHMRKEPLVVLPFRQILPSSGPQDDQPYPQRSNFLILALDETINEDIFWMAGMEFMTILVGAFTDTDRLVSEYAESANGDMLGEYVFCVARMILLSSMAQYMNPGSDSLDPGAGDLYPGVASMMRAIDLVRNKYAFDSSIPDVPWMRSCAKQAVQSVLGLQ